MFILDNLLRDNVKNMKPYASARDEFQGDAAGLVFLDANESPFKTDVHRYPDPYQQKVKEVLASQKGLKTFQLLIGNGSDEVLDLIFRAFCNPGKDAIITMPPTYGMYEVLANLNEVAITEVPLTVHFEIEVDKVLRVQDKNHKILFICSPNNPSGNAFSHRKMEALIAGFHGIVVIDEAYIDFSTQTSFLKKLGQYPNVIVTQTLSKAYGMAGIRVGVCYASEEIIKVLNRIKPPYNVNKLSQERALDRLRAYNDVQSEIIQILRNRTELLKALEKISCIIKIFPTDANFILVRVDDANLRYQQLLEKGIVVRNRTTQLHCNNCLRFTVGTTEENSLLIKALKSVR
ncbi:MAG: histidinol-phosphate transaminase [Flavobacteriaceae bacterium]|nr:histidinol-phosphate transaminase [Flavobacteriaceae bacterium]